MVAKLLKNRFVWYVAGAIDALLCVGVYALIVKGW